MNYKGRGEHSINELEQIIDDLDTYADQCTLKLVQAMKQNRKLIDAHKAVDEVFSGMGGDHKISIDEIMEVTKPIRAAIISQ